MVWQSLPQRQLPSNFSRALSGDTAHLGITQKRKMAIILPTGQWYAPSAVINDGWYYMVLHGII